MTTDDHVFIQLLRDTGQSAPTPPGDSVALGALRRGRRRRNRHRAVAGGCAAVLALGGIAAVQLLPQHGRAAPATPDGKGTKPDGRATASPTPFVRGSAPATPSSKGAGTDVFLLQALAAVLPSGTYTGGQSVGAASAAKRGGGPNAATTYHAADGSARINLSIDRVPVPLTDHTLDAACPSQYGRPTGAVCVRTVGPDGSVLMVDNEELSVWTVVYTGADGRQVRLDEDPVVGRTFDTKPPLTEEQLTAAVTNAVWDPVFAARWKGSNEAKVFSQPNPASGATDPSQAQILAAVHRLLPPGVTPTDTTADSQGIFQALLKVAQGGRTGTVTVQVDRKWLGLTDKEARKRFEAGADSGSLTHTADGSSVITRVDGTSGWSIWVLTANDTRIMVTEWNGTSATVFPPGTPVLSVDQLTAIATAPVWAG
jgi:hypothetical protein